MQNPKSSNLTDLIQQVEQSVADASMQTARVRAAQQKSHVRRHFAKTAVFLALAGGAYFVWHAYAPPSESQVAEDLEKVLDMTKASVDAAKASSGAPPAAIPNASLAAVVVYEPGQQDYKLSASVMGIRVTLQRDGSKTRDTEDSK